MVHKRILFFYRNPPYQLKRVCPSSCTPQGLPVILFPSSSSGDFSLALLQRLQGIGLDATVPRRSTLVSRTLLKKKKEARSADHAVKQHTAGKQMWEFHCFGSTTASCNMRLRQCSPISHNVKIPGKTGFLTSWLGILFAFTFMFNSVAVLEA